MDNKKKIRVNAVLFAVVTVCLTFVCFSGTKAVASTEKHEDAEIVSVSSSKIETSMVVRYENGEKSIPQIYTEQTIGEDIFRGTLYSKELFVHDDYYEVGYYGILFIKPIR